MGESSADGGVERQGIAGDDGGSQSRFFGLAVTREVRVLCDITFGGHVNPWIVDVAVFLDLNQAVVFESSVDGGIGDADCSKLLDGGLLGAVHAEDVVGPGNGV